MSSCPKCNTPLSSGARFCGACGTSLTAGGSAADSGNLAVATDTAERTAEMIGREIAGRYRILAKLGEGGMGAVYRAEQISLKRTVALKLLKGELSEEPGLVARFNAEAELAAKLNHPNTVTLYDFGQCSDGTLFIAMEFVEGTSLRKLLMSGGPMPAARALKIAEQVAASLADAHEAGIVHRDLKPDNVMLSTRGKQSDVVTVLDFGIAKLRDERTDVTGMPVTQAGDLLGTPQYMAPEQIRAETVDGRTDVYALGAMLYEMVTGKLPFEGPTVMAILSKHLTELPTPPSVRRPDLAIPGQLSDVVMQTLQKAPAHRPASMEALGDKLTAMRSTITTLSQQSPLTPSPAAVVMPRGPQTRPPGVPASTPAAVGPGPHSGPVPQPGALNTPSAVHGGGVNTPMSVAATHAGGVHTPMSVAPTHAAGDFRTPVGADTEVSSHTGAGIATAPTGAAIPAPGVTAAPVPTPAASSKKRWLLAAACLLVAAGAGAGVVLSTSGGGEGASASAENPNSDVDGPDPGPGPARPIFKKKDAIGGSEWKNPLFGYTITLPFGYIAENTTNASLVSFRGTHQGQPSWIVVSTDQIVPSMMTPQRLDQLATALVAKLNGVIADKRMRTVQGQKRMSVIYDVPSNSTRWAFVIYLKNKLAIILMHGTSSAVFPTASGTRFELFEKRIQLPAH